MRTRSVKHLKLFDESNLCYPRSPLHRENGKKKSLSGKTQEILKFCQNTGITKEILYAPDGNSLIQKIKDIATFCSESEQVCQVSFAYQTVDTG